MKITQLKKNIFNIKSITGNKQYVARVLGLDTRYGYQRHFLAYQKPRVGSRVDKTVEISDNTILEVAEYTHGGNLRSRKFYRVVDGDLKQLKEGEILKWIH